MSKHSNLLLFAIFGSILALSAGFKPSQYASGTVEVKLDRTNDKADSPKFSINYKLLDLFAPPDSNDGPILVAICGQHKLETCMSRKQAMLEELAPRLNAAILFVEHRFYGSSTGAGFTDDLSNLAHLTVENVLADIKEVIQSSQLNLGEDRMQRTLLVGEDYAGALALWMAGRELEIMGAWVASPSPLALWPDVSVSTKFDKKLTKMLADFGCVRSDLQSLFAWIEEKGKDSKTMPDVKKALFYDGNEPIETVKANVLQLLRHFVAWRNVPEFDEKSKNFVWPVEKFCLNLKDAGGDGQKKAQAMGKFVQDVERAPTKILFNYQQLANDNLEANEIKAQNYQRCTQLPLVNCAAGGAQDAFFQQCQKKDTDKATDDYILSRCKSEWLAAFGDYDDAKAASLYQPKFVSETFRFDLSRLKNVLITTGQLDQFVTAILPAFPASDPSRNFYVFSRIGLSIRGQELLLPNSCNSLALKQARTQVADVLTCFAQPRTCPMPRKWPVELISQSREEDAAQHLGGKCQPLHWQYPWAEYQEKEDDDKPKPKPDPKPEPKPKPEPGPKPDNGTEDGGNGAAAHWTGKEPTALALGLALSVGTMLVGNWLLR